MSVKIYHNPRCSKSRAALAMIRERGIEPEIIDYLQEPPSVEQLEHITQALGVEPQALLRRSEPDFSELGLDPHLDDGQHILAAIHDHPRLLQRPIVMVDGRGRIGRPPEVIAEILP
ncbi:MAG: arsenate reductase (glutaredoxin) [Pseudomonadota bacterium]|nr:MAG: arsenate reductase (glutaredoxin) [Pseudomonadota bacterium]